MKLLIKPEFQAAMFPLSPEEKRQLEENIVAFGCLDPIKEWVGCIVDGHNRFEICTRLGIEFKTVPLHNELNTVEEVLDWIDKNQLGRRNLTPDQMRMVRGRRYNREKKAVGQHTGNQHVERDQNDPIPERTAERHAKEAGVSPATIKRDAAAVAAIEPHPELTQAVQSGALPLSVAVQAAELPPEAIGEVLASEDPTKAVKVHVANNSGNMEWYTPHKYIEAARLAMGSIDTDPASCEFANQTVRATTYYTAETNGLDKVWTGNVWLNPPYCQPLISEFAESVTFRFSEGEIEQAIVLVNNATETAFFQRMLEEASAICFPRTRIRYINQDGPLALTPLQGQAFIYFGEEWMRFKENFSQFGKVVFC